VRLRQQVPRRYELSIFNDSPRPATITKLETLASDHNASHLDMSRDEITALALLTANYPASPAPVSETRPDGRDPAVWTTFTTPSCRAGVGDPPHNRHIGPFGPDQGELPTSTPRRWSRSAAR